MASYQGSLAFDTIRQSNSQQVALKQPRGVDQTQKLLVKIKKRHKVQHKTRHSSSSEDISSNKGDLNYLPAQKQQSPEIPKDLKIERIRLAPAFKASAAKEAAIQQKDHL